jgi:RNA polymerase sigma factor (sigma-70 family)
MGVDPEALRVVLARERLGAEDVRALAGLVWGFDERMAGATSVGYRGSGAELRVGWDRHRDHEEHEEHEEVVAAHRRRISAIARSYSRSDAEREDLEQDISLALWQALPKFRGESSLTTFVQRVARYCCYRQVRRRARAPLYDEQAVSSLAAREREACPEARLAERDDHRRMREALGSLPETLASALDLHLAGLSYAEIAERLGISERNVSVRLTRARRHLRNELVPA